MKFYFSGPSHGYIEIDNQRVMFSIKVSRHGAKRYRYVLHPDLGLVITRPRRGSPKAALDALELKEAWLRQALERTKPAPAMYLGERVYITKSTALHKQTRGRQVCIPSACADPQKYVINWYRTECRAYLEQRLRDLAQLMGVIPAKVSIRDQRTRWGSCSSKGTLSFSWRLIMTPPWVFDAIIIHELAHLKELNHSSRFWEIVHKNCPNYEEANSWLKYNGSGIRSWRFEDEVLS